MIDWINRQNSVVNRIIDGTITIDSVEEFENLLEAFPNNPRLLKVFADLTNKQGLLHASETYRTTAALFLREGLPLQAITCKIIEWRIDQPSDEEKTAFYSALCACKPQNTISQEFFTKFDFVDFFELISKIKLHTYAANTKLIKFGDQENRINFIVSGALEKTNYHRLDANGRVQKFSATNLIEGDIFGTIYPFETNRLSESEIVSISRTELLTLSKEELMALGRQGPNLEEKIQTLCTSLLKTENEGPAKTIRKAIRHQLPTQVNLKIFQKEGSKQVITLSGFTEDFSLEGACVVLGLNYQTGNISLLIGAAVKIQMNLPIESIKLHLLGNIVWGKEIFVEDKRISIVGIKFKDINPVDRGILEGYCLGSEAEQNLIWSLWSTLVKS